MCIDIYEYKTAEIMVLYADVSKLDINKEYPQLSQYRKEKIKKLKQKKDKKMSLGAELLLIKAVKLYCPKIFLPLEIETNRFGKPMIKGADNLHFNLAHSQDIAVCAISDKPVGVDTEHISRISEKIRDRYFTENEKKLDFGYIWTRKEAVVKADGTGISIGLDTFDVSNDTTTLNGRTYTLKTFKSEVSDHYISLAW